MRVARRLRAVDLPDPPPPFTAEAWCAAIARQRRRGIHVVARPLNVEIPPGFVYTGQAQDLVVLDAALPPMARTQTLLHEVAHLLLDHQVNVLHEDVDREVEREAEIAADLLALRLARAAQQRLGSPRSSLWPVRGTGLGDGSGWLQRRQADWDLHVLWTTMRSAVPEICLDGPHDGGNEAMSPLGARRARRHRQVVEIHDALRQLRPWYCMDVYLSAQRRAQRNRLDPVAARTIAEAAGIAVALRRKIAGADGDIEASHAEAYMDLPASLRPAAHRLARLSHAMQHSPLVTAEVAKWGSIVTGARPATLTELRPQRGPTLSRAA
ncbi:DUF6545 domain-containing protein [Micromonospora globbae]|uniref:ImmA/IrrE family metallo-endopeptidase n=1 Tax=Micromonospora globbae TaxID=1894969 RepID=A0A420ESG1_9ACTN|nr:DUF6545 domain-containing protein [Micromonospora globbae]RKF23617.1 ImmA/IrrE family metallo-endopeptidase [Micromonospora globbae]